MHVIPSPSLYPRSTHQLRADVDYSEFRFRAEVDFVEVRVTLARRAHPWTLKTIAGAIHAKPIGTAGGGTSQSFLLNFNSPQTWFEVQQGVDQVEADYGLDESAKLTKLEVAFDARHQHGDHDKHAQLLHRLFKYSTQLASDNIRIGQRKSGIEGGQALNPSRCVARLRAGDTLWVGDQRTASVSQRFYVKTTDSGDVLDAGQHRARMEVTLQGNALDEWNDLRRTPTFRFESLTRRGFCWRSPDEDALAHVMSRVAHCAMTNAGQRAQRGRRVYDSSTKADKALNSRAYDALRGLTLRMQREPNQRKPLTGFPGARTL